MAGVGANIRKKLPNWIDWEVAITLVHTIKNVAESIKLKQSMVEKWMLSQAIEELLKLYVSMSKGTVPKVVKKTKTIYLTHG